jgi:DNA-binding CsgD family transcriptional regulator
MTTTPSLTAREIDVLRLIARGCTYEQAAHRLGISPHTITTYIKSSYYKLAVHSAGAAVMRALELGILGTGADIAQNPVQLAAEAHTKRSGPA